MIPWHLPGRLFFSSWPVAGTIQNRQGTLVFRYLFRYETGISSVALYRIVFFGGTAPSPIFKIPLVSAFPYHLPLTSMFLVFHPW